MSAKLDIVRFEGSFQQGAPPHEALPLAMSLWDAFKYGVKRDTDAKNFWKRKG